MLSKEKLKEIGIINQIKLNLDTIPETNVAEKNYKYSENTEIKKSDAVNRFMKLMEEIKKSSSRKGTLVKYLKSPIELEQELAKKTYSRLSSSSLFNETPLDDSKPEISSATSEALAEGVTKLKM